MTRHAHAYVQVPGCASCGGWLQEQTGVMFHRPGCAHPSKAECEQCHEWVYPEFLREGRCEQCRGGAA